MLRAIALTLLLWTGVAFADDPQSAEKVVFETPCEIVEVYDGDTITVTFVLCGDLPVKARVRLLDCWAPEVTGDEKPLGLKSRDYLRELVKGHTDARLVIPARPGADRLDDHLTFGRILGRVYLSGQKTPLAAHVVKAGHAYKTKRELRRALSNTQSRELSP